MKIIVVKDIVDFENIFFPKKLFLPSIITEGSVSKMSSIQKTIFNA